MIALCFTVIPPINSDKKGLPIYLAVAQFQFQFQNETKSSYEPMSVAVHVFISQQVIHMLWPLEIMFLGHSFHSSKNTQNLIFWETHLNRTLKFDRIMFHSDKKGLPIYLAVAQFQNETKNHTSPCQLQFIFFISQQVLYTLVRRDYVLLVLIHFILQGVHKTNALFWPNKNKIYI